MEKRRIISNSLKCLECNEAIWSAHRHDFVECSCGKIAVDGGMDYMRRVGNGSYEDTSMTMNEDDLNRCIKAVEWAKDTGRNNFGIALAVIRAMRDANLLNMEKF